MNYNSTATAFPGVIRVVVVPAVEPRVPRPEEIYGE